MTDRLLTASRNWDNVVALYENGLPAGLSTGWNSVDELYTVPFGQWTVVTGVPNSGKSEWLDALAVNLTESCRMHFAVYSPENRPYELHQAKLLEKKLRKPFGRGPTERINRDELQSSRRWLDDYFVWISPGDTQSLVGILEQCGQQLRLSQPNGVIIDPWNYVEHNTGNLTKADYLSTQLSILSDWVRETNKNLANVHVWIVAHPKVINKDRNGQRPVPTPYDLNDGAMWYNKADNIVCVHRDMASGSSRVEIHVQKIRFKHCGRIGMTELNYDRVTGRYNCPRAEGDYRRARDPGDDDE